MSTQLSAKFRVAATRTHVSLHRLMERAGVLAQEAEYRAYYASQQVLSQVDPVYEPWLIDLSEALHLDHFVPEAGQ